MDMLKGVTIMEFTEMTGGAYEVEKMAIFNKNNISEKEVWEKIRSGEYDDRIIVIYAEQFDGVFVCKEDKI